mmetsp:Transcript_118252/g.217846  ORF Transcript_118252/g.217846 Transcript_118252/m.217846 type:complete len:150 (+) Transcript_118252:2018-2467(+)
MSVAVKSSPVRGTTGFIGGVAVRPKVLLPAVPSKLAAATGGVAVAVIPGSAPRASWRGEVPAEVSSQEAKAAASMPVSVGASSALLCGIAGKISAWRWGDADSKTRCGGSADAFCGVAGPTDRCGDAGVDSKGMVSPMTSTFASAPLGL